MMGQINDDMPWRHPFPSVTPCWRKPFVYNGTDFKSWDIIMTSKINDPNTMAGSDPLANHPTTHVTTDPVLDITPPDPPRRSDRATRQPDFLSCLAASE
eukprot:gene10641-12319_t